VKIRHPVALPRRTLGRRRLSSKTTGNSYGLTGSRSASVKSSKECLGIGRISVCGPSLPTFTSRFREPRIGTRSATRFAIPARRVRTGSGIINFRFRLLPAAPPVDQRRHHGHLRVEHFVAAFRRRVAIAADRFRFRFRRVPIAVVGRVVTCFRFRLSGADADDGFVRTARRDRRGTGRSSSAARCRHRRPPAAVVTSGHVISHDVISGVDDEAVLRRSDIGSDLCYGLCHPSNAVCKTNGMLFVTSVNKIITIITRGVFLANRLASNDNLTRKNHQKTEYIATKTNST